MRTAADVHANIKNSIEAAVAITMRADKDAVQNALNDLASDGRLDEQSLTFLRRAHGLVLSSTVALGAAIDVHASRSDQYGTIGCLACGTLENELCRTMGRVAGVLALYQAGRLATIDSAEAWRRASAYFARDDANSDRVLIAVEEFADGFLARPVRVTLPPPPAVPDANTERVLVIDKVTREISSWPLMPTSAIAVHYLRYMRGGRPEVAHSDG